MDHPPPSPTLFPRNVPRQYIHGKPSAALLETTPWSPIAVCSTDSTDQGSTEHDELRILIKGVAVYRGVPDDTLPDSQDTASSSEDDDETTIEYCIMVYHRDLVWIDTGGAETGMSGGQLRRRNREINGRVEVGALKIYELLEQAFKSPTDACFSWTLGASTQESTAAIDGGSGPRAGECITLKLRSKQSDLQFGWDFTCMPSTPSITAANLINPMLKMIGGLQLTCKKLQEVIAQKQTEVDEHVARGSRIDRNTKAFDDSAFGKLISHTVNYACQKQWPCVIFSNDLVRRAYEEAQAAPAVAVFDADCDDGTSGNSDRQKRARLR